MATIYLSSTYVDLVEHREAVYRALRRGAHEVKAMEDYVATDARPLDKCLADVAACDVYVGIFAWRYGYVPTEGNPDGRSVTELEYMQAGACGKPRLLFLLQDEAPWPVRFVDKGAPREHLDAFRDRVGRERLVGQFRTADHLAGLVFAAVTEWEKSTPSPMSRQRRPVTLVGTNGLAAPLRPVPREPDLPAEPYPLLRPYTDPRTFGGRDWETARIAALIEKPQLVLCLHAPSGAGKSSLLKAGLEPHLRARARSVYVERRPDAPGLARRLVENLLMVPEEADLSDDGVDLCVQFARWMAHIRLLAGAAPVLVLDQVDDLLRKTSTDRDAGLARLGPLMASTAQPTPGTGEFFCRWVLCYRQEFHGEVCEWLQDVLVQARRAGRPGMARLPYDLKHQDSWHDCVVPVVGAPRPGNGGTDVAMHAFLDAIQKPLVIQGPDGRPRYPLRFDGDSVEHLAAAFARARRLRPSAPLVPELQVVLAHLLGQGSLASGQRVVTVPADPKGLDRQIDDALAAHLRRGIESAYPMGRDERAVREGRSRALLALRELTDAKDRRAGGLSVGELSDRLGAGGANVIEKLASPEVRLVVREETPDGSICVLSHDRMAAVVRAFVDQEHARLELDVDPRIVHLDRFVAQRSTLFERVRDQKALDLTRDQYRDIEHHASALVPGEQRATWWLACRARRAAAVRRHRIWVASVGLLLLPALAAGATYYRQWRNAVVCGAVTFERTAWCLPSDSSIGFVEIPKGLFQMGSNKKQDRLSEPNELWPETPDGQASVWLDTFYVGRHEVTVGQYSLFLKERPSRGGGLDLGGCLDCPIASVSWTEALAYARWLETMLAANGPPWIRQLLNSGQGWHVTLPSEAEWEKAARGTDGRIHPWGDRSPSNQPAGGRRLVGNKARVGSFPANASPYGVLDMNSNVSEWTRSLLRPYPYDPRDGRENTEQSEDRVLRGGNLDGSFLSSRVADRLGLRPDAFTPEVGFRVAISRTF